MIVYAADDEKFALELLKKSIIEALPGVEPVCFRNSAELLTAAQTTLPDLVFLDIQMPGLTGIEVAGKLNEISDSIKIIFVTGYSDFTNEAFDVYASGYLLKPCRTEAIQKVLAKLNLGVGEKSVFIKTFGNFDVLKNGESVKFRSPKSKELLAYLVDREGAFVSRNEAIVILFEEDDSQNTSVRLSQYAKKLAEDLEAAGIPDLFVSENGFSLNMDNVECDLVEYMKGNPKYKYAGEYMEQYSFGEFKKETLYDVK